jgi:hypothetical protein
MTDTSAPPLRSPRTTWRVAEGGARRREPPATRPSAAAPGCHPSRHPRCSHALTSNLLAWFPATASPRTRQGSPTLRQPPAARRPAPTAPQRPLRSTARAGPAGGAAAAPRPLRRQQDARLSGPSARARAATSWLGAAPPPPQQVGLTEQPARQPRQRRQLAGEGGAAGGRAQCPPRAPLLVRSIRQQRGQVPQ